MAVHPLDLISRLAALTPKPQINLTLYHAVLTPNHREREMVTPIKRGKGVVSVPSKQVRSPTERHDDVNWAQSLKGVFNTDIEVCIRCGGPIKAIFSIENQESQTKFCDHLRDKDTTSSTLPLLIPTSRAHPQGACLLSRESARERRFQSDHNQP